MKQMKVIFKAVLLTLVFASLAACRTDGGGGVARPARLGDDATYQQALDKLDEVIAYCEAHPGDVNDTIKISLSSYRNRIKQYGGADAWEGQVKTAGISIINANINSLE
jgi:hypothetical protein